MSLGEDIANGILLIQAWKLSEITNMSSKLLNITKDNCQVGEWKVFYLYSKLSHTHFSVSLFLFGLHTNKGWWIMRIVLDFY